MMPQNETNCSRNDVFVTRIFLLFFVYLFLKFFSQFLFHSCNICLQWSNVLITLQENNNWGNNNNSKEKKRKLELKKIKRNKKRKRCEQKKCGILRLYNQLFTNRYLA